jgi:hypothetical protein
VSHQYSGMYSASVCPARSSKSPRAPPGPPRAPASPFGIKETEAKIGSADSPPPPVLGSWCGARKGCLARAIGPSGGPCHPAPGDAQGNVSRQLAGAVVIGGGGAAPAPPLEAEGDFALLQINRLAKKKARCPGLLGPGPEGMGGMAELRRLFPGGPGEGAKHVLSSFAPRERTAARR